MARRQAGWDEPERAWDRCRVDGWLRAIRPRVVLPWARVGPSRAPGAAAVARLAQALVGLLPWGRLRMRARLPTVILALALLGPSCGDDGTPATGTDDAASSTGRPVDTASTSGPGSGPGPGTTELPSDTGTTAPSATSTAADTTEGSTTRDDTSTGEAPCEAPTAVTPCDALADAPTPLQAIGLDCPGDPDEAIPLSSSSFLSPDPQAWRVGTQLGSHLDGMGTPTWGPTHGDQLLMISTGSVAPPDELGRVTMATLEQDANDNPDDKPLPAPMVPTPGSGGTPLQGCDGVGDCSDSVWDAWLLGGGTAYDLLWFQLATEVPGGTHGFGMDVAFFSEEFPESVATPYNDMFLVWSSSESYVGNLCFVEGQACTVTSLWPVEHEEFAPELQDTGFAEHPLGEGGGTGWFRIRGSAAPHEVLELTFALFDMGDEQLDTLVLLDGFGWECQGCDLGPPQPCGAADVP